MTLKEIEENRGNADFWNKKIIKIEDLFKEKKTIILTDRELELFLNGVKISIFCNKADLKDDSYRIYNKKNEFIGLGEVKYSKLKRDVII